MISKLLRKSLRFILAFIVKSTLSKHQPLIIVITGDEYPTLIRETVYNITSSQYNTRRNIERADSEFSTPLTILGILYYPTNALSWITIIIKSLLQLIYLKPYNHALVLQLNYISKDIFNFWLDAINPRIIVNTQDHYKYNNAISINLSSSEIQNISTGIFTKSLEKLATDIGIPAKVAKTTFQSSSAPTSRLNFIPGKKGSFIIDARHYYYPPNIETVLELSELMDGTKVIYSTIKSDKIAVPNDYVDGQTKSIEPSTSTTYIFRGRKDEFIDAIRDLSINGIEI